MHKAYKEQLQTEMSTAKYELYKEVTQMVRDHKENLAISEITDTLQGVLSQHSEPAMQHIATEENVAGAVALMLAKGYANLTPIQEIASSLHLEDMGLSKELRTQAKLELVAGVARIATYLRVVEPQEQEAVYIVSELDHPQLDARVYDVDHPLPSTVALKPLVDINSNAYRADNGYRVMLGSKFNKHDNPMPMWLLNHLGSVGYMVEEFAHPVRPLKPANPKHSKRVQKQHQECQALHQRKTYECLSHLWGKTFFFPHSFDKRERVYSFGHQIKPQGTEYDKSVLEFANKEVLTKEGEKWLHIATANVFGKDKLRLSERLQWVSDNMDKLEDLTAEAAEPLLFAKHVRAIRNAQAGKPIGIPVHMDATNSGAQVIGAFFACETTLRATNVIPNKDNIRNDLYGHILNVLGLKHVDREVLKKATVPAFYGSTAEPRKFLGKDVDAFWLALEKAVPAVYQYLTVLPNLWDPRIEEYTYTVGDGYKMYIPVTGILHTDVECEVLGRTLATAKEVQGTKDRSKCFLAHMVHSYDAYILRNIVKKCKAHGIDIMVIHDSFGTHPNHMGKVVQWYKEELSKLIKDNPLPRLLKEIFGHNIELPYLGNREELAKLALQAEYSLT